MEIQVRLTHKIYIMYVVGPGKSTDLRTLIQLWVTKDREFLEERFILTVSRNILR